MTGPAPILDINGKPIDPIWAAEFRGFFWGEGTIRIQSGRPQEKAMPHVKWVGYSTSMHASIGLRSDDAPLLMEFQRRLGGTLRIEKYRDGSSKTLNRWTVARAEDTVRIAALLKSNVSRLPFNKRRQLKLWTKAVEIKLRAGGSSGSRYTPKEREFLLFAESELHRLKRMGE